MQTENYPHFQGGFEHLRLEQPYISHRATVVGSATRSRGVGEQPASSPSLHCALARCDTEVLNPLCAALPQLAPSAVEANIRTSWGVDWPVRYQEGYSPKVFVYTVVRILREYFGVWYAFLRRITVYYTVL